MSKYTFLVLNLFCFNILIGQITYTGDINYKDFLDTIQLKLDRQEIVEDDLKFLRRQQIRFHDELMTDGNWKNYQNKKRKAVRTFLRSDSKLKSDLPSWKSLNASPVYYYDKDSIYGTGRVTFIEFHPLNSDIIFVGSPTGYVWRSDDKGQNWEIFTKDIPNLGFEDLVFDANDPNVIYLLTGDSDGGSSPFFGIFKTTDAGNNWTLLDGPDTETASKLLAHPSISGRLILGSYRGVFFSNDSGLTWQNARNMSHNYDLVFDTENPNKLYAIDQDTLKVSLNSGESFQAIKVFDLEFAGRKKIALNPKSPHTIYVQIANKFTINLFATFSLGIYKSIDSGQNFQLVNKSDSIISGQQYYNMVCAAYPKEEEILISGYVNLHINEKEKWRKASDSTAIHVDHHVITFDPENEDCVWIGNDGGIFRSCDFGITWECMNHNINLSQVYNFGHSNICEDLVLFGGQDMGTNLLIDDRWEHINGGDGFSCGFSYLDDTIAYFSTQNMRIRRADNLYKYLYDLNKSGGYRSQSISVNGQSGFYTKFHISPSSPELLFFPGYDGLYKSTDKGDSWLKQEGLRSNRVFAFSETNPDLLALEADTFYMENGENKYISRIGISDNKGASWEFLEVYNSAFDLFEYSPNLVALTFDADNLDKIWAAYIGNGFCHVFHTNNRGETWTNQSKGLPHIKMNDLKYQPYSDDALYLATDMGVYYRDTIIKEWIPYNKNLPLTEITELKISSVAEKLRASTYGSGIWEVDLYDASKNPPFSNFNCKKTTICQGESANWNSLTTYDAEDIQWQFEGGTPSTSTKETQQVIYSEAGEFSITLISKNENGIDTLTKQNVIEVLPREITITENLNLDGTTVLTATSGFDFYLWNTGDTISTITVENPGWYNLIAFNDKKCIGRDSFFVEPISSHSELNENHNCIVYPNPNFGHFKIKCLDYHSILRQELYTATGQLITQTNKDFEYLNLAAGLYKLVLIYKQGKQEQHRIMITQ